MTLHDMTRNAGIPASQSPPKSASGARRDSVRTTPQNFTSTTTILVGTPPTPFHLHTTLLTSASPYFRSALLGSFLESTSSTNTITLSDISTDLFELVVSWLYTSEITPLPFKDGKPAYYTLLNLYALADRLCFEGLRNKIVDVISELADRTNSVLTASDTRILYNTIPESLPIRNLVLDLFAFKKTDKLLATHDGRWHAQFLRDLCVHLKRPNEQALQRHSLQMWIPESWETTRSCESCHGVLRPRYGAVECGACYVAWCVSCVGEGVGMAGWEDGRPRPGMALGKSAREQTNWTQSGGSHGGRKWESCKPWRASRCTLYHEHRETEECNGSETGVTIGR